MIMPEQFGPTGEFSKQVLLERTEGSTTYRMTTWIPEDFAQKNRLLRIKNDQGEWEDGWIVASVGGRMDSGIVHSLAREHLEIKKRLK